MAKKRKRSAKPPGIDWKKRLRTLRDKLEPATSRKLAEELGVSVDTLRGWLYRKTAPSPLAQKAIVALEAKLSDK